MTSKSTVLDKKRRKKKKKKKKLPSCQNLFLARSIVPTPQINNVKKRQTQTAQKRNGKQKISKIQKKRETKIAHNERNKSIYLLLMGRATPFQRKPTTSTIVPTAPRACPLQPAPYLTM